MDTAANQKSGRRGLWLALLILALTTIVTLLWIGGVRWGTRGPIRHLMEIHDDHAMPYAENAATAYRRLLKDPNATSLLDDASGYVFLGISDGAAIKVDSGQALVLAYYVCLANRNIMWVAEQVSNTSPEALVEESFHPALWEPWIGEDYPELAAAMDKSACVIRGLVEASQFDRCWFPIAVHEKAIVSEARLHALMRRWALLLCFAANNGLAEGHVEAAIANWQCLIQMSDHLRQQPRLHTLRLASQVATLAFVNMMRFVMGDDPPEAALQQIEGMRLPTEDQWLHYLGELRVAEKLVVRALSDGVVGQRSVLDRLKDPLPGGVPIIDKPVVARARQEYCGQVVTARATRILVALRRYQQTTGQWPERLDDVSESLPNGILIDPFNGARFVYRRTEDAFELYSAGENKLDERRKADGRSGDDWPIWPPMDDAVPPGETPEP